MTFLVAWVALPALLGLMSLGAGFVVERLAMTQLRAPLLVTTGFAAISVVGQIATLTSNTAAFATPASVALAVICFGLWLPKRRGDWWSFVAATGAYGAYAAQTAASGSSHLSAARW
jgi:hypothetical protein